MDRRAWKKRSLHLAFWIQTHVRCCKDLSKWGEKNRDIEEWNAGRHWLLSVISVAWYENGNHVENLCSTTSNRPSRSPLPLHSSGEGLIGPGEVNSSGPLTFGSYCFFQGDPYYQQLAFMQQSEWGRNSGSGSQQTSLLQVIMNINTNLLLTLKFWRYLDPSSFRHHPVDVIFLWARLVYSTIKIFIK